MRYLFVLPLLAVLQGCWFIYIPGSMFQKTGEPGNTCISRAMYPGDKIKHLETQTVGTVRKVYGPSPRCTDSGHPNLADVDY